VNALADPCGELLGAFVVKAPPGAPQLLDDVDPVDAGLGLGKIHTAVDAGGKPFRVKATKGWKMLTFGASWCKPCAKELPAWDGIARLQGQGRLRRRGSR